MCIVTGLHELVIQRPSGSDFPQLDSFSQGLLAHLFHLLSNAHWHQTLQCLEKLKNLGRTLKQYKCKTIKQSIFNHNLSLTKPPLTTSGWSLSGTPERYTLKPPGQQCQDRQALSALSLTFTPTLYMGGRCSCTILTTLNSTTH